MLQFIYRQGKRRRKNWTKLPLCGIKMYKQKKGGAMSDKSKSRCSAGKNWYYDSRVSGKLQEEIKKFSRKTTKGFTKPARKWIGEMTYGVLKSKDIKLTNVGRAIRDDIDLKYTVKRLSRNIVKKDVSDQIIDSYLPVACKKVKEKTVLSLDLSDISKKEAKKMDNLCKPWNGSEGKVSDKGYWFCKVVAKNLKEDETIPLYNRLFSTEADDFESENKEMFKSIDAVTRHTKGKGIWTVDRGGDRRRIYDGLLRRELRFVIRLITKQRHLEISDGSRDYPINIASRKKLRSRARFENKKDGRARTYNIRYGYKRVFLPKSGKELTMVIAKGFGREPMLLLTDVEVRNRHEALMIIRYYISRWVIEESFRFIKQSYSLEDIRLRRYNGLKNMLAIIVLVYGFLSLHLLLRSNSSILTAHIYERSKRLYGIPNYSFYALADGVFFLLSYYRDKFKLFKEFDEIERPLQLLLFNISGD